MRALTEGADTPPKDRRKEDRSNDPAEAPLGRDAVLGYFGVLVTMAYPVGFLTLGAQLANEYGTDVPAAVYAVSLAPGSLISIEAAVFSLASVAVSVTAAVLGATCVSALGLFQAFVVERIRDENKQLKDMEARLRGVPIRFAIRRPKVSIASAATFFIVAAAVIANLFGVSRNDAMNYALFLLSSGTAGALAGSLVVAMPRAVTSVTEEFPDEEVTVANLCVGNTWLVGRLYDRTNALLNAEFRRWVFVGVVVAVLGALPGAVFLAMTSKPGLPVAEVDHGGRTEQIDLLSLSGGYWHGFDSCDRLVSIPAKNEKPVLVHTNGGLLKYSGEHKG